MTDTPQTSSPSLEVLHFQHFYRRLTRRKSPAQRARRSKRVNILLAFQDFKSSRDLAILEARLGNPAQARRHGAHARERWQTVHQWLAA